MYIDYESMYTQPLYRPPSEAYSLILQITLGCSHNKCSFCTMYKGKKYQVKSLEQIKSEIDIFREHLGKVRRIFLADGDAFSIETEKLIEILNYIKLKFPECERISSYASPKSIAQKSDQELKALKEHGIDLLYMGIESGDDKVLEAIHKDITSKEYVLLCKRVQKAGFKISATFIVGICGAGNWESHAKNTGKFISEVKPDYVGILRLRINRGSELDNLLRQGKFKMASYESILEEMKMILENIYTDKEIIFRANHASNYVPLGGTLPQDKEKIIHQLEVAIENSR